MPWSYRSPTYPAKDAARNTEGLPASLLYHKDFRPSIRERWVSRREHIPVRFTMRGSAQFTGLIEWFTPHAVKVNIGLRGEDGTASVVLHRHAVLRFELLEEPKDDTPTSEPVSEG